MRISSFLLSPAIFAWEIQFNRVGENENSDQVGRIGLVQSKGATKYKIVGAEVEIDPFIFVDCPTTPNCVELRLKSVTDDGRDYTLDREEKEKYSFNIQAFDSDGNIVEEDPAEIFVRDENDNQPTFTQSSALINCAENVSRGVGYGKATCGYVKATDPDSGNFGKVEYRIDHAEQLWYRIDGTVETRQNFGLFTIDQYSGEITLVSGGDDFDREKYEKVEITVTAQDNPGKVSRTPPVEQQVLIMINDVNDNKVNVNFERQINVSELEEIGTILTKFNATDADATEKNNFISFEILNPNSPFALNAGSLILKEKLDFEEKKRHYVTIRAFNKQATENIEQTETKIQIEVKVIDENEAPIPNHSEIIFKEGDQSGAVAQNRPQPLAKDLDFNETDKIYYQIEEDLENYFKIEKKSGQLIVNEHVGLVGIDRECSFCINGYYSILIQACDTHVPSLCSIFEQKIRIVDLDDNGPKFSQNQTEICPESIETERVLLLDNIEVIDADDRNKGHWGNPVINIDPEYHFFHLFQLEKISDFKYRLYLNPGSVLEEHMYDIPMIGYSNEGGNRKNEEKSFLQLSLCQGLVEHGGGFGYGYIALIVSACLLAVLIVFTVTRLNTKQNIYEAYSKSSLLEGDEWGTKNTDEEGGVDVDQTNLNLDVLIEAKEPKSILRKAGIRSIGSAECLESYLNGAVNEHDKENHGSYDNCLLTYAFEGRNSILADLSSISSAESEKTLNMADETNVKFQKLARMFQ